jgi:glutamyl-Q tRNA(Asp) synthetase
MEKLNLPIPNYLHFPVVLGASGDKLSKQTHATPVSNQNALDNLKQALRLLGQQVPDSVDTVTLLEEAIANWNRNLIPKQLSVPLM